jgi:hypothetical protein
MGSVFIILPAEALAQNAGFGNAGKERPLEELIPETTVETLPETVLPGTTRINVIGLNLPARQPGFHRMRDELWPVVAPQKHRRFVRSHQRRQGLDHFLGRQGGRHHNREAFACEVIADGPYLEFCPVLETVKEKVVRPDMARIQRHQRQRSTLARRLALLARTLLDLKMFLFPDPMHTVTTHFLTLAPQPVPGFDTAASPLLLREGV